MCLPRVRARVASAATLATACLSHHRLVFHKRGADGSAKATLMETGRKIDRVWGVVLTIDRSERPVLDEYESGYDVREIVVANRLTQFSTITYMARAEAIDRSLKPFSWYHDYVLSGARQHRLPDEYVEYLQSFDSIPDPDQKRHWLNKQVLAEMSLVR